MHQAVSSFIKRHQLLIDGDIVVVGVSGGPDSMALLDYLERTRGTRPLTVVAASVDHGLRGEESAADLRYVEDWCSERNIPFEGTHFDVTAFGREHNLSVEAAARACRYHFFAEVMQRWSADKLALAHHGDDQIETMLMRQVRGSIGEARSGIPIRRPFTAGEIVRPFLAIDKEQIEAYCCSREIEPRRDPSNDSDDYTRNRFRHHILPFLKKENPNVHVRFQQESQTLRDDHRYLEQLAKDRLNDIMLSRKPSEIILSIPDFLAVPIALQRRMIHLVLNCLYKQTPSSLSTIHIEDLLDVVDGERPSAQLDFPQGLRVIRSYERLRFTYQKEDNGAYAYHYHLQVPGKTELPVGILSAKLEQKNNQKDPDDGDVFVCDADLVRFPLSVRTRRPGDHLRPKGMKGSKKVKAIFIEQKVRREMRQSWPLVTDSDGEILWLPGLKHAGNAAPSERTKRLLILSFDRVKSERTFRT